MRVRSKRQLRKMRSSFARFGQERHLVHHFSSKKHLEMEGIINLRKTAEEYCIEQDETAMNESVSVPDTN